MIASTFVKMPDLVSMPDTIFIPFHAIASQLTASNRPIQVCIHFLLLHEPLDLQHQLLFLSLELFSVFLPFLFLLLKAALRMIFFVLLLLLFSML